MLTGVYFVADNATHELASIAMEKRTFNDEEEDVVIRVGEPAHGPPHVAGGASGPIGGCRDESRTDNPDLDLRHVFDRNNRKTDLI